MNERIKLLLKQSGLQPYYAAQEDQIDQFAELILRECIDVADDYVKDCLCEEHIKCNHPRSKIGIKIQKHFGVEE